MTRRVLIAAVAAIVPALAGDTVELRFAPADGVAWQSRFESERRIRIGDTPRTDQTSSSSKHVFKKTDSGYEVGVTVLSTSMKSGGHEISNPMMKAIENVELDYILDENGKCTDIRGYDKVLEAMKTTLPGPFFQQMAPLFNAPGLRVRDMRIWNERFAELVGETVEVGQAWAERDTMSLPSGGSKPFYTLTTVEGWAECGEDKCLKLVYRSSSDRAKLVAVGENAKAALDAMEDGESSAEANPGVSVSGEGERIFDPATMRIHSETLEWTTAGKADFPGRGERAFEVVDKRTYSVR